MSFYNKNVDTLAWCKIKIKIGGWGGRTVPFVNYFVKTDNYPCFVKNVRHLSKVFALVGKVLS
jgi:hypothetical protein